MYKEIIDCQPALDWLCQKYLADGDSSPSQKHRHTVSVINNNIVATTLKEFERLGSPPDAALVRTALSYLPADNREDWISYGMACKADGVPFEVWREWSNKSAKYVRGECEEKWKTFKPNGNIRVATIFHRAVQNGFRFSNSSTNSRDINEQKNWSQPGIFEEPILFGEIETPEITSEFLPSWVQEYVKAVAAHTQTPIGAVAMLVLAILAACIQRKYEISPRNDSYIEPLVIWVLLLLPPASRKTQILNHLLAPIQEWEKRQLVRLQPGINQQKLERAVMVKQIEELTKQAAKAKE